MGTNIYLVKQITKEDIEEIKKVFNNCINDLETSRDINKVTVPVEEALEKLKNEIHICKRSAGWQLLFESHKELYECTWKSMTDYIRKVLNDDTYIMVDEYGKLYSLNDLKEDLEAFKNGWTHESYKKHLIEKRERVYPGTSHEYISDNLRWTDDWFC